MRLECMLEGIFNGARRVVEDMLVLNLLLAGVSANGYCNAKYPSSVYQEVKGHRLVSVHLVTRHGDRAPLSNLPPKMFNKTWECDQDIVADDGINLTGVQPKETCSLGQKCKEDPEVIPVAGTCLNEQLTPKGIDQLYRLGSSLRRIYSKLIPNIKVRSTDTLRTYWSAVALLGGLQDTKHPKGSIEILPAEKDDLLQIENACQLEKDQFRAIRNTAEIRSSIQPIRTRLQDFSYDLPQLKRVEYNSADSIRAHTCHQAEPQCQENETGPCLTQQETAPFFDMLDALNRVLYFDHPLIDTATHRMRMGPFLLDLKKNLLDATSKFFIVSAHDITISSLLAALDIPQYAVPPYASNFLIELWEPDSSAYKSPSSLPKLRFIYNGQVVSPAFCQPSSDNNSHTCGLDSLMNHLDQLGIILGTESPKSSLPPFDFWKECDAPSNSTRNPK